MNFIYATRSILSAPYANTVQSANMACAFSRLHRNFRAVFRVPPGKAGSRLNQVFGDLALDVPPNLHCLRSHPWLDWTETYFLEFVRFLRKQPATAMVYTRSGRFAWISTRLGHPTVLERHDPLTPRLIRWLIRMRSGSLLTHVVATTPRLKKDILAATGFPSSRILVAGGGANIRLVDLNPLPLRSSFAFNAGYAGSAFKGKGVEMTLACARQMPDVGFHLIGPSRHDVAKFGHPPSNVIIHGRRSNLETVRLLKSMDCLLLPNQRSVLIKNRCDIAAHTSPLKMFEYMTTGRPIIASSLPVFDHVLEADRNAVLCLPECPEDFCQKIRLLREKPEVGVRIGQQALNDFRKNYSWDQRAETITRFISANAVY